MASMASQDSELVEQAVTYLLENRYPEGCKSNTKRTIRRKAEKFIVKDREVYYIKPRKTSAANQEVRYICKTEERKEIMTACHYDVTSGHMGIKRTLHRIMERFFWKGITKDVELMVSHCASCQKNNEKLQIERPELHPVQVKSPWYHIAIDFIGPVSPASKTGNRYILTLSDYFTKWVEAVPLPTKEAIGVASVLFKIFMRMGIPTILTTDQGSEFKNRLNEELMKLLNIKHHLTTAYHPQANGLDERYNQTLQNMLRKYIQENKESWDEFLETCTFAYNTSRHESSLHTPFEVMFGRQAMLPIDIHVLKPDAAKILHESGTLNAEATELLMSCRKEILQKVKQNIALAQKKQKEQYDRKHATPPCFKIRAQVLKKDFKRKNRKGGKFDPKWLGPYTILEDMGKGFYKLGSVANPADLVMRINGAHLKMYYDDLSIPSRSRSYSTCSSNTTPSRSSSPSPSRSTSLMSSELDGNDGSCNGNIEDPVVVLQKMHPDDLVDAFYSMTPTVHDIEEGKVGFLNFPDFLMGSCGEHKRLANASSAISCLTVLQYKKVIDFLISTFCQKDKSSQLLSYILDVVYPQVLHNLIMKKFAVTSEKAEKIMYTVPKIATKVDSESDAESDILSPKSRELYDYVKKRRIDSGYEINASEYRTTASQCMEADQQDSPDFQVEKKLEQHTSVEDECKSVLCSTQVKQPVKGRRKRCGTCIGCLAIACGKCQFCKDKPKFGGKGVKKQCCIARRCENLRAEINDKEDYQATKSTCVTSKWSQTLDLSWGDMNIMKSGLLSDKHMYAAHKLLHVQFPHINGLQTTLLCQTSGFVPVNAPAVQIHYSGHAHWVTSSYNGHEVHLYNSFAINTLSTSLKMQLLQMYKAAINNNILVVLQMAVQQQVNHVDCGLFSIAFALHAALGHDVTALHFNQACMRKHLMECFEKNLLLPFPTEQGKLSMTYICSETRFSVSEP